MKDMKLLKKTVFLLLTVSILLCSCNASQVRCETLLLYALDYGIDGYKDNGNIFLKSAEEGDAFFISQKVKKTMYGERFFDCLEASEDYAIYVSASTPYEIAIFKCFSRNDIDNILRMCYERADELKVALRFGKWAQASKSILISEFKNYILFLFTESGERNENIAEELKKTISN